MAEHEYVYVADLAELTDVGIKTVQMGRHTIVLVRNEDQVYAVDNRCPHMGFPLDKGTAQDGLLICHWHHARFDLASGGTFDQWADDIRAFPVDVRGDEIWIDLQDHRDLRVHHQDRLRVGLERDISLVIGKAVLALTEGGGDPVAPFRTGLEFGVRDRQQGWGQGLTMHSCQAIRPLRLTYSSPPSAIWLLTHPPCGHKGRPIALCHTCIGVKSCSKGNGPFRGVSRVT